MFLHLPRRFCAIIFTVCIIFTIALLFMSGNYLPKSFWTSRPHRIINDENSSFQRKDDGMNDSASILRLLRAFSIVHNNPLFLLDSKALNCWYRDCGIIPHTTDMDFAAFATDYNEQIEPTLNKDKILKLYWRLGKANDSLEFSVYYGSTKLDLFFLYKMPDSNQSWVGGMIVGSRTKLRWTYPRLDELCTADLKGHLFHVPCNVEAILESDYGPEWYVPHHTKDFVWHKSHRNVHQAGHWRKEEWSEVYRLYDIH